MLLHKECLPTQLGQPVEQAVIAATFKDCDGYPLAPDTQLAKCSDIVAPTPQALSLSGSTLTLSGGGGSVVLPDTQNLSISGNVLSLTDGGSVTLPTAPGQDPYATPAQTAAGTATALIVNPADLYARENMPAQTGLSNDVTAIPAPTASQSPWGVNGLGETLHYSPSLGWKIVADRFNAVVSLTANFTPAQLTITPFPGLSLTMPRAGVVDFTVSQLASNPMSSAAIYLLKNGVAISRLGGLNSIVTDSIQDIDFSGAAGSIPVAAGDVFTVAGQWHAAPSGPGAFNFNTSLSRFTMQYQ